MGYSSVGLSSTIIYTSELILCSTIKLSPPKQTIQDLNKGSHISNLAPPETSVTLSQSRFPEANAYKPTCSPPSPPPGGGGGYFLIWTKKPFGGSQAVLVKKRCIDLVILALNRGWLFCKITKLLFHDYR